MKQIAFTIILALCFVCTGQSQTILPDPPLDPAKTYAIKLYDGTQLIGSVLEQTATQLTITTTSIAELRVAVSQIKSIEVIDSRNLQRGEYYFANPHATRYLFAPSAYTLDKGDFYYQNTYLLINSINYGLTNNFTIGGGFELISTFSGEPIFFITPKLAFPITDKLNMGGGILYANVPSFGSADDGEDSGVDRTGVGILYGIGTYGSPNHNLSIGLGWGYVGTEIGSTPVVTLSGITRIAKKTALLTENWLVPAAGYQGIYSYGIRFFGEAISVDLAFLNNREIAQAIVIGIPYVDFAVKF